MLCEAVERIDFDTLHSDDRGFVEPRPLRCLIADRLNPIILIDLSILETALHYSMADISLNIAYHKHLPCNEHYNQSLISSIILSATL